VLPAGLALLWVALDPALAGLAQAGLGAFVLVWVLSVAVAARNDFLRHVRTLSNLVEAIRTQDYGMKASRAREPGELAELYQQLNTLADNLKRTRQNEQEVLSVLEKVVSQINVAIIVFDSSDRIRLANRQAASLLDSTPEELLGVSLTGTVLSRLPLSEHPKLVDFRFPGAEGRWQVSQHHYRNEGVASRIVFVADLEQVLSDEEIGAWQRLIRVIGHEVNNSLTPITSLSQTLTGLLARPDAASHAQSVREGLGVIGERAKGLQEFISTYARLARLPEPQKILFSAAELAASLRRFFTGRALEIEPFPEVTVFGDPVHLEQALINLIKNALEANPADAPAVRLGCRVREGHCEFVVVDGGPGISNPGNLFVPFYTTKGEGAGIGLVLCRQIATKHRGQISLENRQDGRGAVAKLVLPLPPSALEA
jgi:nitrogen fixation/metabolism regulation signal transduction histidine kinase